MIIPILWSGWNTANRENLLQCEGNLNTATITLSSTCSPVSTLEVYLDAAVSQKMKPHQRGHEVIAEAWCQHMVCPTTASVGLGPNSYIHNNKPPQPWHSCVEHTNRSMTPYTQLTVMTSPLCSLSVASEGLEKMQQIPSKCLHTARSSFNGNEGQRRKNIFRPVVNQLLKIQIICSKRSF